jgi:serine phosphatase RsbU (regulator of sigma subunit)
MTIGSPRAFAQGGSVAAEKSGVERMACLEIRGGNRLESYSVELPGLSAWISCRPLTPSTEGGDLHYLTVCGEGAISRVVLADVAGHGEIVSAVAERLHLGLRKHVNTWDQSILLQELNDTFVAGADGVQYATAFVLGHYVQSGEVLFTNAGHVPPLWYRAAERTWMVLKDSTPYAKALADLPLGLIPGTPYTQTAIQLGPGDLLVLYTDGLSESRDSADRELGLDDLCRLASGIPVELPDEAGRALFGGVERFRGAVPAADDETMIVIRRNQAPSNGFAPPHG